MVEKARNAFALRCKAVAKSFCDDPAILGVVGHVNSGVAIATGKVYADCGLAVITPMASNPKVTESGYTTIFRLTNRDDRKGPGLAHYLMQKIGKTRALVVDEIGRASCRERVSNCV